MGGTRQGIYRYASDDLGLSLRASLQEFFDLMSTQVIARLCIEGQEGECSGVNSGNGLVNFDITKARSQSSLFAQVPSKSFQSERACQIKVGSCDVILDPAEPDTMFNIRCIDEIDIKTQQDLDAAQAK